MSSPTKSYKEVIRDTAAMVHSSAAQRFAGNYNLDIVNITWEDTARFEGSAVGPNISDTTIQVERRDTPKGTNEITCMPVIRYPNFSDRTCDIPIDRFWVRVGNERGADLDAVTLRRYLSNLRSYLSDPTSWKGDRQSLLAERDTHVLVSAQACFLPVPKEGIAQFNPVIFNYQSHKENPAVLAVLCTREGTSATIVDNVRDGFGDGASWGQRLFFNDAAKRTSLTGERVSDFLVRAEGGNIVAQPVASAELNMVLLIQVPLKQKEEQVTFAIGALGGIELGAIESAEERCLSSDVEEAVIGHGEAEGPFIEVDGLDIERDSRYPIRVTVQFYKATSNGIVSDTDVAMIAEQIERVYADATYAGSLVLGDTTSRPTEYDDEDKGRVEPPGWWDDFWRRHEANTGQSKDDALALLRSLTGYGWMPPSQEALESMLRKLSS